MHKYKIFPMRQWLDTIGQYRKKQIKPREVARFALAKARALGAVSFSKPQLPIKLGVFDSCAYFSLVCMFCH